MSLTQAERQMRRGAREHNREGTRKHKRERHDELGKHGINMADRGDIE